MDPAPGQGELSGHFWALLAVDGFLYFLPGLWVLKSFLTVLFLFLRFSAAGALLSDALCYVPVSSGRPQAIPGSQLVLYLLLSVLRGMCPRVAQRGWDCVASISTMMCPKSIFR